MNCPKCKDELNIYDRHGDLRVGYPINFYGGDRSRDDYYCAACGIAALTDELCEREKATSKVMALAEEIGRLL